MLFKHRCGFYYDEYAIIKYTSIHFFISYVINHQISCNKTGGVITISPARNPITDNKLRLVFLLQIMRCASGVNYS